MTKNGDDNKSCTAPSSAHRACSNSVPEIGAWRDILRRRVAMQARRTGTLSLGADGRIVLSAGSRASVLHPGSALYNTRGDGDVAFTAGVQQGHSSCIEDLIDESRRRAKNITAPLVGHELIFDSFTHSPEPWRKELPSADDISVVKWTPSCSNNASFLPAVLVVTGQAECVVLAPAIEIAGKREGAWGVVLGAWRRLSTSLLHVHEEPRVSEEIATASLQNTCCTSTARLLTEECVCDMPSANTSTQVEASDIDAKISHCQSGATQQTVRKLNGVKSVPSSKRMSEGRHVVAALHDSSGAFSKSHNGDVVHSKEDSSTETNLSADKHVVSPCTNLAKANVEDTSGCQTCNYETGAPLRQNVGLRSQLAKPGLESVADIPAGGRNTSCMHSQQTLSSAKLQGETERTLERTKGEASRRDSILCAESHQQIAGRKAWNDCILSGAHDAAVASVPDLPCDARDAANEEMSTARKLFASGTDSFSSTDGIRCIEPSSGATVAKDGASTCIRESEEKNDVLVSVPLHPARRGASTSLAIPKKRKRGTDNNMLRACETVHGTLAQHGSNYVEIAQVLVSDQTPDMFCSTHPSRRCQTEQQVISSPHAAVEEPLHLEPENADSVRASDVHVCSNSHVPLKLRLKAPSRSASYPQVPNHVAEALDSKQAPVQNSIAEKGSGEADENPSQSGCHASSKQNELEPLACNTGKSNSYAFCESHHSGKDVVDEAANDGDISKANAGLCTTKKSIPLKLRIKAPSTNTLPPVFATKSTRLTLRISREANDPALSSSGFRSVPLRVRLKKSSKLSKISASRGQNRPSVLKGERRRNKELIKKGKGSALQVQIADGINSEKAIVSTRRQNRSQIHVEPLGKTRRSTAMKNKEYSVPSEPKARNSTLELQKDKSLLRAGKKVTFATSVPDKSGERVHPRHSLKPKRAQTADRVLCADFITLYSEGPDGYAVLNDDSIAVARTVLVVGTKQGVLLREWVTPVSISARTKMIYNQWTSTIAVMSRLDWQMKPQALIAVGGPFGELSVISVSWSSSSRDIGGINFSVLWTAPPHVFFGPVGSLTFGLHSNNMSNIDFAISAGNCIAAIRLEGLGINSKPKEIVCVANDAHYQMVSAVHFLHGDILLSASTDGSVCLWKIAWHECDDNVSCSRISFLQNPSSDLDNIVAVEKSSNGLVLATLTSRNPSAGEIGEPSLFSKRKYFCGGRNTIVGLFPSPLVGKESFVADVVQNVVDRLVSLARYSNSCISLWDLAIWLANGSQSCATTSKVLQDQMHNLMERNKEETNPGISNRLRKVALNLINIFPDDPNLGSLQVGLKTCILAYHYFRSLERFTEMFAAGLIPKLILAERQSLEAMCTYITSSEMSVFSDLVYVNNVIARVRETLLNMESEHSSLMIHCPICDPSLQLHLVAERDQPDAFTCSSGDFFPRCVKTAVPCTSPVPLICQGCEARAQCFVGDPFLNVPSNNFVWVTDYFLCPLCNSSLLPSSVEAL